MERIYNDKNYNLIVDDIMKSEKFNQIKYSVHHGVSRFDHSLRVSYATYKISKFIRLDYKAAARAGLLHDYFVTDNNRNAKERFKSMLTHPKRALENASKEFKLSEKEANMIEAHMFFANPRRLPKYLESWVLIFADTVIGGFEFAFKWKKQVVSYATVFLAILNNYVN